MTTGDQEHGPENPRSLRELRTFYQRLPAGDRNLWMLENRAEFEAAKRLEEEAEAEADDKRTEELAEARRKEKELELVQQLPENSGMLPIGWVLDGGWALLTHSTKAVVIVLYTLLDAEAEGKWKHIPYGTIGRLAGTSPRTVSRAVHEGKVRGWFRTKPVTSRWRGKVVTRIFFRLPPLGKRKDEVAKEERRAGIEKPRDQTVT